MFLSVTKNISHSKFYAVLLKVFCMAPKPYDKHPEWETLIGHSAPVKACSIASRESGYPLIATASDDCTVQLWDTRNMPSPRVVKLPVGLPLLSNFPIRR